MEKNEIMHYGILGMRWGVRRTPAQLRRSGSSRKIGEKMTKPKSNDDKTSGKLSSSDSVPKKTIKDLSDDELKARVARLQLEKQYTDLSPKQVSKGREFAKEVLIDIGKDVASDMGKQVARVIAAKVINSFADDEIVFANNKKKK